MQAAAHAVLHREDVLFLCVQRLEHLVQLGVVLFDVVPEEDRLLQNLTGLEVVESVYSNHHVQRNREQLPVVHREERADVAVERRDVVRVELQPVPAALALGRVEVRDENRLKRIGQALVVVLARYSANRINEVLLE